MITERMRKTTGGNTCPQLRRFAIIVLFASILPLE